MSITSKYQSNPGEEYWTSMKCILKYLRRTKDMFLVFGNGELLVQGFTDSDFMSDIDDRKSTSEICSFAMMVQLAGRVLSRR